MRKFIYLISPNKIDKSFYVKLDKVLSFKNSAYFQLRLKKTKNNEILNIAKKIKIITKKHKVKFIVNDNFKLASKSEFDGCHLGQLDGPFENTSYKKLIRNGAKYIAISSFIWDNPKLKPEIAIKKFK